ncbi:MAG: hypothetical protein AAF740_00315 [Bacteroidota bacterium]
MNKETNDMKEGKNAFRNIIGQLNEANTVHGGVAATKLTKHNHDWGIEVKIRTPSLPASAYNLEVQGHGLAIFIVLPEHQPQMEDTKEGLATVVPSFFQKLPLSHRSDVENISARYEENMLIIHIPHREGLKDKFRIPIEGNDF